MTAEQALEVLGLLASTGVSAWVDGGWGVDALVGEQTRTHSDLDLVVPGEAVDQIRVELLRAGFTVLRDWLPTAIAFRHDDGREVDLHPVEVTADGGGDQVQLDGVKRWHYEPPIRGNIGGREVLCCPVSTQVRAHLGYEPQAHDYADMLLLRERFGCHLPPPYGSLDGT